MFSEVFDKVEKNEYIEALIAMNTVMENINLVAPYWQISTYKDELPEVRMNVNSERLLCRNAKDALEQSQREIYGSDIKHVLKKEIIDKYIKEAYDMCVDEISNKCSCIVEDNLDSNNSLRLASCWLFSCSKYLKHIYHLREMTENIVKITEDAVNTCDRLVIALDDAFEEFHDVTMFESGMDVERAWQNGNKLKVLSSELNNNAKWCNIWAQVIHERYSYLLERQYLIYAEALYLYKESK